MQSVEIAALGAEHRADCAAMLAARFERQRAAEPLLPEIETSGRTYRSTG